MRVCIRKNISKEYICIVQTSIFSHLQLNESNEDYCTALSRVACAKALRIHGVTDRHAERYRRNEVN